MCVHGEVSFCVVISSSMKKCLLHIRLVWSTIPQWIKWWRLLTIYLLGTYSGLHQQYKDRLELYVWLGKCQDTWLRRYTHGHRLPYSLNFIYCTPYRCSSCCTVYRWSASSGLPHDANSICIVFYYVKKFAGTNVIHAVLVPSTHT